MIATYANMSRLSAAGIEAVAYDWATGEVCSANPGDYWFLANVDLPLTSEDRERPLVLVRRIPESFVDITEDEVSA